MDVLCSQPSKRVRAANAEVVNELLGWRPKERSPALAPGPLVATSDA